MTARTPLPLRLRTTRRKMLVLLLGCSMFVAGGVFVLPTHPVAGYGAIVFFGLGVVVALIQLLPDSAYVELDERGFTTCTLFRKRFLRWEDVAEFSTIRLEGRVSPMVAFRYAPGYTAHATARKLAKTLAGAEDALPDTYGRSAQELAELLNKVRSEHASRGVGRRTS